MTTGKHSTATVHVLYVSNESSDDYSHLNASLKPMLTVLTHVNLCNKCLDRPPLSGNGLETVIISEKVRCWISNL